MDEDRHLASGLMPGTFASGLLRLPVPKFKS